MDCVKRVPNANDDGQVHEINPNMSFKIENSKNTEAYSDEVFLLRKEVEKLKNQKEQIENDYKWVAFVKTVFVVSFSSGMLLILHVAENSIHSIL